MKKFFKFLLGLFAFILIALIITMLVLGKEYHYEKSIVINAPADKVWQHVNSMKAVNSWSPWTKLDPHMKQTYSGISGQIGDTYAWEGNKEAGKGVEKIIELVPNEKAVVDINFIEPFPSQAKATVALEPQGNLTKVTWGFDTSMDYPSNLMKLVMNKEMDKAFGEGLAQLKEISEK